METKERKKEKILLKQIFSFYLYFHEIPCSKRGVRNTRNKEGQNIEING